MRVVAIIQARLTSTRFPRKVLEKVGGKSMIARVCEAARDARWRQHVDKVVVAWAHKFPHLDENDVLGRFQEIAKRENADVVVRLTSDCPLLNGWIITQAVHEFRRDQRPYYCNRDEGAFDGFDVQVCDAKVLFEPSLTDKEHVFGNLSKFSVDTPADLERVRAYAK